MRTHALPYLHLDTILESDDLLTRLKTLLDQKTWTLTRSLSTLVTIVSVRVPFSLVV